MRDAREGDDAAPEPAQALYLAAALLKRRGRLRAVPLPHWAGPARAEIHPGGLATDVGADTWTPAFLARVREASLRGLDLLERLHTAADRAAALGRGDRKSSSLGRAADLALRRPVLTAPLLMQGLGLTHQGALLLLARMVQGGVLREATGRKSFRAFVLA